MSDEYYYLKKGELMQEGDEADVCSDGWRDEAKWKTIPEHCIGEPASDPRFPSHARIRRKVKK